MVKLLLFAFELLTRGQKKSLRVTKSMGALLFSHFRVTNVRLINEKGPLIITVSK